MRTKLLLLSIILFPMTVLSGPLFSPLDNIVHFSPANTGIYLGSPSILRLENGDILAAMDMFGPNAPKPAHSLLFRSTDNGENWGFVTHFEASFWANLFEHNGALYYLGTSGQDGDIVIRKSEDNGQTWTTPTDETNGLLFPIGPDARYHCAPMPVVVHNGRLYRAFENIPSLKWPQGFRSLVISAAVDADLLKTSSWRMSNHLEYDQDADPEEFADGQKDLSGGKSAGWLEGNVVVTPEGGLVNILRVNSIPVVEKAAVVQIHDDGKKVSFDPKTGFIDFPGGMTKFTIRRDPKTGVYWTIANGNTNPKNARQRNSLSLYSSVDLKEWKNRALLLEDKSDFGNIGNDSKVGFQYIDFQFDGEDIIFLSRTAYNGANNYHDANYMTFHCIKDFRSYAK